MLAEIKEYKFTKKFPTPLQNIVNIVFIAFIFLPPKAAIYTTIGIIYEISLSLILLLLIGNQLYIALTEKHRQPSLIIDKNQIAFSKYFLRKYRLIRLSEVKSINELNQAFDNIIVLTLLNNRKIRLSLHGYSEEAKKQISYAFNELKSEITV
ncbi:hypothetical protein [Clostridium manihotivorum]|uniref:DUF304 domain-containing protein n=1 Tax=Clostridium manihotivorum TaxID=2320868 RepID=A0A3R5TFV2_9CLOT|nr:hypothetical protein [Clostridium manihotivorum]QAA32469.1 hypothetical protein C1I91_12920 [Clostridium manihotivorum]